MTNVYHISGRKLMTEAECRAANIGNAREQKAADLAGARWQLRTLVTRLRCVHGDGVAKMVMMEVANQLWPDG